MEFDEVDLLYVCSGLGKFDAQVMIVFGLDRLALIDSSIRKEYIFVTQMHWSVCKIYKDSFGDKIRKREVLSLL
jgi:hypothetical protein